MLKYILLASINYGPKTGYDIKRRIDSSVRFFWHAHHSQIYTLLHKLEDAGLVEAEEEPEGEGRPRRIYHITEAGRQELLAWLHNPLTEAPNFKDEFLVRVYHSGLRDPAETIAELRLHRALHEQNRTAYVEQGQAMLEAALAENPEFQQHAPYWRAVLKFGLAYEELYIRWIDETIATLEELADT